MMRSATIIFTGPGQVELVEEQVSAPGRGEVTFRTTVSLVSTGTELICYRGQCDPGTNWEQYIHYPLWPGYCSVGHVVEVGEGVDDLREGDRICSILSHRQYGNLTTEQIWTRSLPDDISDEQAVWLVLGVITQTGIRLVEHEMGDTAVVIGLGPLGQLVTRYLGAMGLRQVMVVDPVQMRVEAVHDRGATAAFCGSVTDARQFVLEHTDGRLADVVYDVTGHHDVLEMALPLARDFGKVMLIGDCPHPSRQRLTHDILNRQVKLLGSRSYFLPPRHAHWTPQRQTALMLDYLRRGQMNLDGLITHRFDPFQAPEVYSRLDRQRDDTLGVVFEWPEI